METRKNREFADVEILGGDKPFALFIRQLLPEFANNSKKGIEMMIDLAIVGISALFCSTHVIFGAFPLGIALLCAVRRRLLPTLLGLMLGCIAFDGTGGVYLFAYVMIFLIRAAVSAPIERRRFMPICEHYFEELPQLRIALSVFAGLMLSLYQLAIGGFGSTSLLFCLATILLSLAFCLLFLGLSESNIGVGELFGFGKRKRNIWGNVSSFYAQLSLLGFVACITFSLSRASIFGISLDLAFLVLATFFVSKRFGALKACVSGLVSALAINVLYAPSFAVLGLVSGILWQFGSFYSFSLGAAAAVAWASYIGGLDGFIFIMPATTVVSLLSFPAFSYIRSDAERTKEEQKEKAIREQTETSVSLYTKPTDKIFRLSRVFGELSQMFYGISATGRPKKEEYFALCQSSCSAFCVNCKHKRECWDSEQKEAFFAFSKMAETLSSSGRIQKGSISPTLISRCVHMKKIISEISDRATELNIERIRGNKTEFISTDYAMISRLLESSFKSEQKEREEDTSLCELLKRTCKEEGVSIDSIAAYGHRKKRIALGSHKVDQLKKAAPVLHARFEQLCGCKLSPPEFERTSEALSCRMYASRRFDIEYAGASSPSNSGEISGDKQRCFFNRDDIFYSIISDGMGSGADASSTAELCVSFLEKILREGSSKTVSLKMLNNLVRARGNECSATVDMLEIDLLYGRTTFVKSGAAISLVKRGEDIFRIRSKTAPIGLMKNLDAEKTDFELKSGDIIIMLSDGIIGAGEDAGWLLAFLSKQDSVSLEETAKEIIAYAGNRNENRDDMTVSLIRVREAE